ASARAQGTAGADRCDHESPRSGRRRSGRTAPRRRPGARRKRKARRTGEEPQVVSESCDFLHTSLTQTQPQAFDYRVAVLLSVLERYWGYTSFRPLQQEAM